MKKLRIKADRMGELEKFGFDRCPSGTYAYVRFDASFCIEKDREVTFGTSDWGLEEKEGTEMLHKFYDLVKADMVEEYEK